MKRMWSLVAVALLASGVAFGQAGPAEVPAAKPAGLPAGVLAVVEFPSVETLQKHVTDFVNATGALPPGQIPPILEIFDEAFHSTDPSQMDITQPVRFVFVKGGPRKVEAVLQCTVKDPAVYLSTLDPGLKKGEEKDGVTTYTEEQQTVAVGESGKMICIGENAAAVGQVLALVNSNALPQNAMLQGGDVAASIEVKALLNHMADEKGAVFGGLRESWKNIVGMAQTDPAKSQHLRDMLDAEVDVLEKLVRQAERATVSLTSDAQEINLSANIAPVQGGLLAAYLATVPAGIPETLKYLPDDAFAVCAFKLGDLGPLEIPLIALTTKIMASGGTDPAQAALVFSQFSSWFKAIGGEMTFALRSGKAFSVVSAMALKDPEIFKALLQKMPELFGALAGFYGNMGMPMKLQSEVVKYNDREITQIKWSFDIKPTAGATPAQAAAAEAQQRAMKAMFGGDALTQDIVVLGKDEVTVAGSDSLDTVKQIIDGQLKKLADREDFAKTVASIPPESCGFCLVHLTGLVEFGLSMVRAGGQGGPMSPFQLPDIHFQRGPGVTAVCVTAPAGSSVTCNVRVPAAEIKVIADGIKSLAAPPPTAGPGVQPPETPVPPPAAPTPPAPEK
jgi:hypothetical protein